MGSRRSACWQRSSARARADASVTGRRMLVRHMHGDTRLRRRCMGAHPPPPSAAARQGAPSVRCGWCARLTARDKGARDNAESLPCRHRHAWPRRRDRPLCAAWLRARSQADICNKRAPVCGGWRSQCEGPAGRAYVGPGTSSNAVRVGTGQPRALVELVGQNDRVLTGLGVIVPVTDTPCRICVFCHTRQLHKPRAAAPEIVHRHCRANAAQGVCQRPVWGRQQRGGGG